MTANGTFSPSRVFHASYGACGRGGRARDAPYVRGDARAHGDGCVQVQTRWRSYWSCPSSAGDARRGDAKPLLSGQ